jgi:hypothetical protein
MRTELFTLKPECLQRRSISEKLSVMRFLRRNSPMTRRRKHSVSFHELTFGVEPSFQNEGVPMGVEAQQVANGLIGNHCRAPDC